MFLTHLLGFVSSLSHAVLGPICHQRGQGLGGRAEPSPQGSGAAPHPCSYQHRTMAAALSRFLL